MIDAYPLFATDQYKALVGGTATEVQRLHGI